MTQRWKVQSMPLVVSFHLHIEVTRPSIKTHVFTFRPLKIYRSLDFRRFLKWESTISRGRAVSFNLCKFLANTWAPFWFFFTSFRFFFFLGRRRECFGYIYFWCVFFWCLKNWGLPKIKAAGSQFPTIKFGDSACWAVCVSGGICWKARETNSFFGDQQHCEGHCRFFFSFI